MIGSRPPGRLLFSAHPFRPPGTPSRPLLTSPPSSRQGLSSKHHPHQPLPAPSLHRPLLPAASLSKAAPAPSSPGLHLSTFLPPSGLPFQSTTRACLSRPRPSTGPSSRRAPSPKHHPHLPLWSLPLHRPILPAGPQPRGVFRTRPSSPRLSTAPSSRRGLILTAPPAPASSGLHLSTTSSPWRGSLPKAPPTPLQSYLSDTPSSRRGTPQKILSTSCPPLRLPRCQKQTWEPPFRASWPHPGVFGLFSGFFGYFLGFSGCFLKKVGPKTSLFPPLPV